MPDLEHPRFLDTEARTAKERSSGITHVIDSGTTLPDLAATLSSCGEFIDVWKFGHGTAYVDAEIASKVEMLASHGVRACPGGTLLEAAWWQDRCEEFFDWAQRGGFGCVEVSRGATGLPPASKLDLIAAARSRDLEVFAEVGSKDPAEPVVAGQWLQEARRDLDRGARWLVAEGRESGTVGLYAPDGSVRADLVDALERLGAAAPVVYEAPGRSQQAWFINHLGANVNLANISPRDVLGLEALRLGLRSDTMRARLPAAATRGCSPPSAAPPAASDGLVAARGRAGGRPESTAAPATRARAAPRHR